VEQIPVIYTHSIGIYKAVRLEQIEKNSSTPGGVLVEFEPICAKVFNFPLPPIPLHITLNKGYSSDTTVSGNCDPLIH